VSPARLKAASVADQRLVVGALGASENLFDGGGRLLGIPLAPLSIQLAKLLIPVHALRSAAVDLTVVVQAPRNTPPTTSRIKIDRFTCDQNTPDRICQMGTPRSSLPWGRSRFGDSMLGSPMERPVSTAGGRPADPAVRAAALDRTPEAGGHGLAALVVPECRRCRRAGFGGPRGLSRVDQPCDAGSGSARRPGAGGLALKAGGELLDDRPVAGKRGVEAVELGCGMGRPAPLGVFLPLGPAGGLFGGGMPVPPASPVLCSPEG
jgi:hypothetical protein